MLHQSLSDILVLNNLARNPKKLAIGFKRGPGAFGRLYPSQKTCSKRVRQMRKHWDGFCSYCGDKAAQLTGDHVVPRSCGGHTTIDNIVPACGPCNNAKGDTPLLMFLWRRADWCN